MKANSGYKVLITAGFPPRSVHCTLVSMCWCPGHTKAPGANLFVVSTVCANPKEVPWRIEQARTLPGLLATGRLGI